MKGGDSPGMEQLPCVFGRYLLLRRVSQGGMGDIFLARSGEIEGFEKLVVIKKILPHLAADRDFIKRFIDEAQIAVKLSHGNIATVYEVGMVEGEYFLALEYVEGRDLRRTLSRCHNVGEAIPPDLALYVAREVANALAYAHRRLDERGRPINLVHCDISPPNVLLSFEGEVKIIDFGIAKSALRVSATNPNVGFGKFGYMAPEQLISGGVIDRRTDTYALGVVLYEMLVGDRLFRFAEGADYREVAAAVCRGEAPAPSERAPHIDQDLDDLVMQAVKPDQDDRYQTAEEMRDAIQRRLYAMNPSVSADALARFLRRLFASEITSDRRVTESGLRTDLAPFQSDLDDQRTHTVSFAISGRPDRPGPATTPMRRDPAAEAELLNAAPAPRSAAPNGAREAEAPSPGEGPGAETASRQTGEERGAGAGLPEATPRLRYPTLRTAPPPPRTAARGRALLFAAAVLLFTAAGGVGMLILLQPEQPPSGLGTETVAAVDGAPSSVPARLSASQPRVVTATPAPALDAAPRPRPVPAHRPTRGGRATSPPRVASRPPGRSKAPPRPAVRAPGRPSVTPRKVEAKFRAVRREYASFKKAYGPRLEAEWSAVLFHATYGKADSKYEKLDGMIDRLRGRMAKIREGGE